MRTREAEEKSRKARESKDKAEQEKRERAQRKRQLVDMNAVNAQEGVMDRYIVTPFCKNNS